VELSKFCTKKQLVLWNMNLIFHFIYRKIIPTDFHIFQDGYCTTNQFWLVHENPHLPSPGAARGPKQHPLLCAGAESGLGAQMVF